MGLKEGVQVKRIPPPVCYLAVIKLDRELSIRTKRGGSVRANHGRNHNGLAIIPESVLTEDKIGKVERQPCGLPDPHLQQRHKHRRVKVSSLSEVFDARRRRSSHPAGEPLGHDHDLSIGVHNLIAAALTGVLR